MSRLPESEESELDAVILRRLRAGEKANHVAADLAPRGVTRWRVYKLAFIHDIKLKQGPHRPRDPERYAAYFDQRHWPGAAREWLRLRSRLSLEELRTRFGYRTRSRAHAVDRQLTGGIPKPVVPRPAARPNVAGLRRVARRCRSKQAAARQLHMSIGRLERLSQRHRFRLADGRILRWAKAKALRRRIRRLGRRGYRVAAIARIIRRHPSVIYYWNRKHRLGLPLQNYRRLRPAA